MTSLAKQLTAITALIKVLQKSPSPDQDRIIQLHWQARQIVSKMTESK